MRVLFWNTHKNNNINNILSDLILENQVSMVVLAEYTANIEGLISKLLSKGLPMKQYPSCCGRIKLLGSLDSVELRLDGSHYTIQIINDNDILCCVHLNSKLYADHERYREVLIERIVHDIQSIEMDIGTQNTIIVGDFNINPYDSSCIDARYFHGHPIYSEAERISRKVAGNEYYMFYNPMWNFLGDFQKPYGTYYYDGSDMRNTYWNIFDQVILRPCLKDRFVKESLKILSETNTVNLLNSKGHPNKEISDHLPIVFEIMEGKADGK